MSQSATWYHLHVTTIRARETVTCLCPNAQPDHLCVHVRFLREYGSEMFPDDSIFPSESDS